MENLFNKKLGFGLMRLPLKDNEIDIEQTKKMVDYFINHGFNYFDTAYGYSNTKSELAVKECLTSRYPRDKYILTDKLTSTYFSSQEEIIPFFMNQLKRTGVDYFDIYLMHAQSQNNYSHFTKNKAYETCLELKKQGKIKHLGISFHDTSEFLEKILIDHPEIEIVQLQFNYLDMDNPVVQSKACYEVCKKYSKPVIVMEPVKGGILANLDPDKAKILNDLDNGSVASYAIRFAASFDNVKMVLSGMSNLEQLIDNVSYMDNFIPLNEIELEAINKVVQMFKNQHLIACTNCKYCISECVQEINIPSLFALYNQSLIHRDWNPYFLYNSVVTKNGKGYASSCLKCERCEKVCPQHLKIREYLKDISKAFGK